MTGLPLAGPRRAARVTPTRVPGVFVIDLRPARRLLVRLVLAGLFLVAAVQAYRLALLPALLALFEPGEAATGVIRRFGILVFALASYFAYVRLVEKRAARE